MDRVAQGHVDMNQVREVFVAALEDAEGQKEKIKIEKKLRWIKSEEFLASDNISTFRGPKLEAAFDLLLEPVAQAQQSQARKRSDQVAMSENDESLSDGDERPSKKTRLEVENSDE
ncbi:hypothetical protein HDU93_007316 [Gonapodya sp. JEL0774]|nr:hypothetical protein HDU93_007316 [Gonapodya sp. JEL0774]